MRVREPAAMTGTATTKPVVMLPSGANQPCFASAATSASALKAKGVTASNVSSIQLPAVTCAFDVPGSGTIEISTVTDTPLKASVTPTTVAEKFAADQQNAARRYGGVVTTASTNGAQACSVISANGALVALEVASQPHGDAVPF